MEELNGRMIACQILVTGLIARVANDSKDPLRFLMNFRDEIHAVVAQVRMIVLRRSPPGACRITWLERFRSGRRGMS